MRPPVPVVAPLKGDTPVGKLCVSAVKVMWRSTRLISSGLGSPGLLDGQPKQDFEKSIRLEAQSVIIPYLRCSVMSVTVKIDLYTKSPIH